MSKKKKKKIRTGILSKHQRGFGFVTCDDMEKDIFIAASSMGGAMNGDEVAVDLIPEYLWKQSPEGIITKILSRNTEEVAGTFQKSHKFGFVIPESRKVREDIFIRKKDFAGAQLGDKVVARITRYPDRKNNAEGKIVEIISKAGQAGGDIKTIARSYDMRETFPSRVNAEAKAMKKRGIRPEDLKGRRDLRGEVIFTIDGADSKDFDDAVSLKILDNGNYLLGVHIADAAHYVEEGGPLDMEALKRGTSVYLIDQVIPMLPKHLSNNICSLNPGEDRLTLSVDMEVTPDGKLAGHEIYESVINSKARLVYDDISDMLENNDETMLKKYSSIKDILFAMEKLAAVLRENRSERGSLDFDLDEAHIKLNDKGIPVSVDIAERRTANRLIEEFMLLANETVAEHFCWLEVPFIYRVHEKPAFEKMEQLRIFLQSMGLTLRGSADSVHPRELCRILHSVEGKASESVVNTVILRSMQKAFYGTSCEGHFGLALKYYCHFTSPIRRYPDLMIHRIIKTILHEGVGSAKMAHYRSAAEAAAEQSSAAERKAIEVEREVEKLKKAEYMSYHTDEVYDGIVSGAAASGLYVQLENTIEGMIRIEDLWDDYYNYFPNQYALVGEHTGKTYKLGDSVRIVVDYVDIQRREINFQLAQ